MSDHPSTGATPSIRVANAPCSWGTIEGFGEVIPWATMLDELAETGYGATELGDLGYLPDDPAALRDALEERGLAMLGGFEGIPLRRRGIVSERRERLLSVARLLAAVADVGAPGRTPYFILADETRGDPVRTARAGRITPDLALSADEHAIFAANAEEVARLVGGETGLRTLYHHHCAAWVETPDEIARFLDATDPDLIGLVFDTGHSTYGTGIPDGGTRPCRACVASGSASPTCISRTATPGWPPALARRVGTTPVPWGRACSASWAAGASIWPACWRSCANGATPTGSPSNKTCCPGWARPRPAPRATAPRCGPCRSERRRCPEEVPTCATTSSRSIPPRRSAPR
jgi:sugar phosphate isomerase/epimerase